MAKTLRFSRQRERIYEYLISAKEHPSAEMIHSDLREEAPDLSLGTVYRNLTLLADIGEIARLRVGDGVDHFDADTSPHYHFICQECDCVIDLEMDSIEGIVNTAASNFGGEVMGHVTYFYGKCPNCRRKAAN